MEDEAADALFYREASFTLLKAKNYVDSKQYKDAILNLYTQMQDGREFSEGLIYLLSVDKSKRDEITLYLRDNFTITGKINWIWPELEIVDKKGRIMKIEWEDIKYITVKLAQYKLKQFPSLL